MDLKSRRQWGYHMPWGLTKSKCHVLLSKLYLLFFGILYCPVLRTGIYLSVIIRYSALSEVAHMPFRNTAHCFFHSAFSFWEACSWSFDNKSKSTLTFPLASTRYSVCGVNSAAAVAALYAKALPLDSKVFSFVWALTLRIATFLGSCRSVNKAHKISACLTGLPDEPRKSLLFHMGPKSCAIP